MTELAIPAPTRIGQATAIEQSRAVAEVYAAVMIARQAPRNEQAAIRYMEQACRTPELADRAFYTQKRSGGDVTDASVHLARELARCWGNLQHSVAELRRDDEFGQSEMQAVAWDLETNTRVAAMFIQPHKRDKKTGPERLVDMQSIYESNANAGARRVRQCIFAILPRWYVERAKTLCRKTLEDGGGKPLPERIAEALRLFEEEYQVSEDAIVAKLGRPSSKWTPVDLANLRVTYGSLQQGTVTRDEAFPQVRISAEEIRSAAAAAVPAAPEAPAATGEAAEPQPDTDRAPAELVKKLRGELADLGIKTVEDQRAIVGQLLGRMVRGLDHITTQEGARLADDLATARGSDDPARALDYIIGTRKDGQA